jgi:tripartite-type tricarboxylate transporter receptor subunit TctC
MIILGVVLRLKHLALPCAVILVGTAAASHAQSVAEFYEGRQITLVVGADTGGGYDAQGRLMARHLGRFIPGHPAVIVQNVPAANSLVATNSLYNVAPKDGSTIGFIQRGMLTATITDPANVRFDLQRFNWIGNLSKETAIVASWHSSPVKTAQDLFDHELIVGGTNVTGDNETTPRLLNALIGTKFKIVSGYKGTAVITLAMEQGEVEGIADWSWSNVKAIKPEYLRDHRINLLFQVALQKAADLPDVPLALDYARNDTDRRVMELFLAQKSAARPVLAPPGVPADRVAALRAAFMAMAGDRQFQDDAIKAKLEIDPEPGDAVDKVVALISATPPEIARRLIAAISPPK